jgi:hypothetical protein
LYCTSTRLAGKRKAFTQTVPTAVLRRVLDGFFGVSEP